MHVIRNKPSVSDAIELIRQADQNTKLAKSLYDELLGLDKEYGGLTVSHEGDYVTVDDGADRWFAEWSDFESALCEVVSKALAGKYRVDERGLEDQAEAYNDLCGSCPAIYSRIGMSRMTAEEFYAWLQSDEYPYTDADDQAEYFGVHPKEDTE